MQITSTDIICSHCGETCDSDSIKSETMVFCCIGCKTVYEILSENNLCNYYDLNKNAGVSLKSKNFSGKYDYLEEPKIEAAILDFKSANINKVTLYLPSVHCSSCIWLLENFQKIQNGVYYSQIDFLQKKLNLSYDPTKTTLKIIVELLATLGYEPQINLSSAKKEIKNNSENQKLLLKIGLVGFCMGNIMLLSFPEYFHLNLNIKSDVILQKFFLYLNFLLSLPVYFYGSSDYLKKAWLSAKELIKGQSVYLSVDFPIALGISALFFRSTYETIVLNQAGYWDSLSGLVFFLLLGKWVQQTTFGYLSFERNYTSYFPLAVKVIKSNTQHSYINIDELTKDQIIEIRNEELIPADSILISGTGLIDYSFVTGESIPTEVNLGEKVYAGGKQIGNTIQLEIEKPVSKSYFTQLWNNEAFNKKKATNPTHLADVFSKYFTFIAVSIACFTAVYWHYHNPELQWSAFTAVLMVACPCALTLSMPFTMGAVLRIFGKNKFYVKNQDVIQHLNEIDVVVFDKTGTLTTGKDSEINYKGIPLSETQQKDIKTLVSQSLHPLSKALNSLWNTDIKSDVTPKNYEEIKGKGISGHINENKIRLGSEVWILGKESILDHQKTTVHVEINLKYLGYFEITTPTREGIEKLFIDLNSKYELALLSGDNAASAKQFEKYFNEKNMHFRQSPQDKLDFVKKLQEEGKKVLMVGDGLNDAGALKQSDVGIVIAEDAHAFTPACDAILDADGFKKIFDFLNFGKIALNTVKISFLLSLIYNFLAITWAASGSLSPIKAAIFMPISTITVVGLAVLLTEYFAHKKHLTSWK